MTHVRRTRTVRAASGLMLSAALLAGCGTTVPLATQTQGGGSLTSQGDGTSQVPGQGASDSGSATDPSTGGSPAGVSTSGTSGGTRGTGNTGTAGSTGGTGSTGSSGGSIATSGSGTPSGTGGGSTSGATAGASGPDSGRGFTKNEVYIGVTTQSDASAVGGSLGTSTFDFGDQQKIISAAIEGVNSRGGFLGRKIVPIYYDVMTGGDASQQSAEACALWTQDHKVISVSLVGAISTQQMFQCLHKAKVPIITGSVQPYLAKDLATYAPELQFNNAASIDRMVDPWIATLNKLGYFSKWDAAKGAPGSAPVKIGILHQDVPFFDRSWALVKARLEARGFTVEPPLTYAASDVGSFSNYALKLRTSGVTHLFLDNLASAFYPQQAESQGYRARYGISTFNYLQPFLVGGAPKAQLAGMMGIGWQPHVDVADAQDPGVTPGQKTCLEDMRRAGANVTKRNYRYIAYVSCDIIGLEQAAAKVGGFGSERFVAGFRQAAPAYDWTSQFGGRAKNGDATLLGNVRGLIYDSSCSCTKYSGGLVPV